MFKICYVTIVDTVTYLETQLHKSVPTYTTFSVTYMFAFTYIHISKMSMQKMWAQECFPRSTKMTLFMPLSELHDHTYIDTDRIVMSLQSI